MQGECTTSPLELIVSCAGNADLIDGQYLLGVIQSTAHAGHPCLGRRLKSGILNKPMLSIYRRHHLRGANKDTCRRLPSVDMTALGRFGHQYGSSLKDPQMVLGDVWLDFSYPNIFLYEFKTYYINQSKITMKQGKTQKVVLRQTFQTSWTFLDV